VAVALAACGGSSSGASNPQASVRTYLHAIANGDGGAACGVLASELQKRALSVARSQGIKAHDCASLFSEVQAHMDTAKRNAFLHAKITHVSQTGNNATVTIAGSLDQPTLTKRGGSWVITGGIGF